MRCKANLFFGAFLFLAVVCFAQAEENPKEITTKSGLKMVLIPTSDFEMGSQNGQSDEKPVHKVRVDAFYMDKYLVSQEAYEHLMGSNPSRYKGSKNPVEQVRWSDAARYCNARSKDEGLEPCYDLETWKCDFTKNGYRLPTEAEWEYACRAGTKSDYFFGDKPKKLQIYAWYKRNSGRRSRPVGRKRPNPWGLVDMYGNLWEWCNDFYQADYYKVSPTRNPKGPQKGSFKVLRGGCWDSKSEECRSSSRYKENPAYADACFGYDIYGFRCVRKK